MKKTKPGRERLRPPLFYGQSSPARSNWGKKAFTSTSLFPDVNVLLAMAHEVHPHHGSALRWTETLPSDHRIVLCRFTQHGLLRLLTNASAMREDVLTMNQAWAAYDAFSEYWRLQIMHEPSGMDTGFRNCTTGDQASTKLWADGYLAAFAEAANIRLVTFDQALAKSMTGSLLLRP